MQKLYEDLENDNLFDNYDVQSDKQIFFSKEEDNNYEFGLNNESSNDPILVSDNINAQDEDSESIKNRPINDDQQEIRFIKVYDSDLGMASFFNVINKTGIEDEDEKEDIYKVTDVNFKEKQKDKAVENNIKADNSYFSNYSINTTKQSFKVKKNESSVKSPSESTVFKTEKKYIKYDNIYKKIKTIFYQSLLYSGNYFIYMISQNNRRNVKFHDIEKELKEFNISTLNMTVLDYISQNSSVNKNYKNRMAGKFLKNNLKDKTLIKFFDTKLSDYFKNIFLYETTFDLKDKDNWNNEKKEDFNFWSGYRENILSNFPKFKSFLDAQYNNKIVEDCYKNINKV